MNDFEQFAQLHYEMDTSEECNRIHREINRLNALIAIEREKLEEAETPFRIRIAECEQRIKNAVMADGKSVQMNGVKASYKKGRSSTSWKDVATEAGATNEMIKAHTKVGRPSVSVKLAS